MLGLKEKGESAAVTQPTPTRRADLLDTLHCRRPFIHLFLRRLVRGRPVNLLLRPRWQRGGQRRRGERLGGLEERERSRLREGLEELGEGELGAWKE